MRKLHTITLRLFIYSGDVMEKKNGVTISLQYNININLF